MHKSIHKMIKVGSRVKFLHSTGAGIVRSIKDNMANVDVDGFEIPVLISDIVEVTIELENAAIVKIGPSDPKHTKTSGTRASTHAGQKYGRVSIETDYEDDEVIDVQRMKSQYAAQMTKATLDAQPAPTPPKIEPAPYEDTDYTVKLVFVPSGKGKAETLDLDAYLVNDSSYELNYCIGIWRYGYVETLKCGKLEADTKELIKRFSRASFAQIQTLHVSLQPFKPVNFVPQMVENFDIELHPLKFIRSGNYTTNDYFDEPSFLFSLTGDHTIFAPKIEDLSPKKEDIKHPAPTKNQPQIEDLHIEKIMGSHENLEPSEVIKIQLARFTFVMDTALKTKQKGKIVFIHGVGKGKLKYELKKILDTKYPKNRYQDASFAEYGYGAIMVFV